MKKLDAEKHKFIVCVTAEDSQDTVVEKSAEKNRIYLLETEKTHQIKCQVLTVSYRNSDGDLHPGNGFDADLVKANPPPPLC